MLSSRWYKVIHDLASNKTRTALVTMAIAVGVFAIGSVFITQEVLIADMNTQYQAVNATTITMGIESFDSSLVRWAERQKEVADAQGRAVYVVKLIGESQTFNLDLYGYDDYRNISLNRINVETGGWNTNSRSIMLERTSAALVGIDTDENLLIEMPDGSRRELTLSGTVHDVNAVPANLFPQLSGYVSMKTLGWLGLPSTYNRLEILTRDQYRSLSELEIVGNELKKRLRDSGVHVDSVQVRKPGEHWAQDVTRSFTLILSFIGVFSLVMSGFLVVNTMSALLAEQRRQIGIMKAIGGTGRQIVGVYLVLVICYGLLSLVVALPAGAGLAYILTRTVSQFLNIDIINFHLPMQVFILQAVTALLVPVVAALVPVLGGVRVTIREAISNNEVVTRTRAARLNSALLKVNRLPRPVLLSLRNTFRRKGRLLLTLGTLTVAGTLFITVVNVRSSLMLEGNLMLEEMFNYEIELILDGHYNSQGVERRVETMPGVIAAEGQTGTPAQRIKKDGTRGATFSLIGVPPTTDFMHPNVLSGRWLQANDRNAIVLGSGLAKDMPDVKVGDTIVLNVNDKDYEWKVAGIMQLAFDKVGYAGLDYVSGVAGTPGMVTSVHVRTENKDGKSQAEMAKNLEERLKAGGIKVAQSMTRDVIVSMNANQFDFLVAFLMVMAAMTALIGGLGLAGMMSLNVMERTREIGVMRSIGASNSMVRSVVLTEGVLIGVISWIFAIPLSVPMNLIFNVMLGQAFLTKTLTFVFTPAGVIIWFLLVVIFSMVAGFLPARRAAGMSVRETLAYE